jgi:nitroimidazol reductase NimA-like FMN-containing flavoprotein (pyridoxamine 5'-phosphate oxidase superfamily)
MTDTMTARRLNQLSRQECLRLLARVPMGRIVFTHQALPAIRPVNHIVDDGDIVIRSHRAAAITAVAHRSGVVVAYEADEIDAERHLGWSVIVTGRAYMVENAADVARYQKLIDPWVAGEMDQVIRIHPEIITGFELVAADSEDDRSGHPHNGRYDGAVGGLRDGRDTARDEGRTGGEATEPGPGREA